MPDPKTALLALTLTAYLCAAVLAWLWRQGRQFYPGIGLWLIQALGQAIAYTVLAFGGTDPDWTVLFPAGALFTFTMPALSRGMDTFSNVGLDARSRFYLGIIDTILALVLFVLFIWLSVSGLFPVFQGAPIIGVFVWFYGRTSFSLFLKAQKGRREYLPSAIIYGLMSSGALLGFVLRLALVPARGTETLIEAMVYLVLMVMTAAAAFAQNLILTGRIAANLADERSKFRITFNNAPYSIILTRLTDGRILEVNERLSGFSGYREEEILGRTTVELGFWVEAKGREALYKGIREKGIFEADTFEFRRRDGLSVPCFVSARKLEYDGAPAVLTVIKDMSEIRRLNSRIEEMATMDMLTGLPNRRYFYDLAAGTLARAARSGGRLAIVTVSLDNFKRVNDTFGHTQGDQIIIEAGKRIKSELREGDFLARFGGDEFVALLTEISRDEDVLLVMERVMATFSRPFEAAGIETRLTCSQGAAVFPEQADDLDRLIALSDAAVHWVKLEGKQNYRIAQGK